jgi:uncharacterized membrane protein
MSDETGTTSPSAEGLSDTAAGAIAYITWIPAVIFLVMAPYNQRPFVKFHAWQNLLLNAACLVLYVAMVILSFVLVIIHLGLLAIPLYGLLFLALVVAWIMCIVKASQGSAFKLPVISGFASKLSGYSV